MSEPIFTTHSEEKKLRLDWYWEPPRRRTLPLKPNAASSVLLRRLDVPGIAFARVYLNGKPRALAAFARAEPLTSKDDTVFQLVSGASILKAREHITWSGAARIAPDEMGLVCLGREAGFLALRGHDPIELFWRTGFQGGGLQVVEEHRTTPARFTRAAVAARRDYFEHWCFPHGFIFAPGAGR